MTIDKKHVYLIAMAAADNILVPVWLTVPVAALA